MRQTGMVPTAWRCASLVALAFTCGAAIAADPIARRPAPRAHCSGSIAVRVQPIGPQLRQFFNVPADRGLLVAHVERCRGAQPSVLRVGDIIITAGQRPVRAPGDLAGLLPARSSRAPLRLRVVRGGREQTLIINVRAASLR